MENKLLEKGYVKIQDIFGEEKTNKASVIGILFGVVAFATYLFFGPEETKNLIENNKEEF